MNTYRCRICNEFHEGPPLSYASPAPAAYFGVPEEQRQKRCQLSSDLCVIDGGFFFLLGNVSLPIVGEEQTFRWTVWVSLSETSFRKVLEIWEKEGREKENPRFGWLSTSLPGYPETLDLKTHVYMGPVGSRPEIELEPTDHPLSVQQREGITRKRVEEIAAIIKHARG